MVSLAPTAIDDALPASGKRSAPPDPDIEPVAKKPEPTVEIAEDIFCPLREL